MEKEQDQISPQDTEKLKEIPKLARKYTQNRTAPLIIFSLIFLALFGVVFLSVYLFLKHQFIPAGILIILYAAGVLYFVITWDKHETHYFTKTGIPENENVKQIRKFLPIPLILCVIASVIMEQYGIFSAHLRVPISAIYICPLLIFANWQWGKGSFIGYLWAALYGGWAIGILFNVPVLTISGGWTQQLNPGDEICFAVPVTGLITGLAAYIYSRYSLRKLKGIAQSKEDEPNGA